MLAERKVLLGVALGVIVLGLLVYLPSNKPEEQKYSFPSHGEFSPIVPNQEDWVEKNSTDLQGALLYTLRDPGTKFVQSNSKIPGLNTVVVEALEIPNEYPATIQELEEKVRYQTETSYTEIGTFKNLPAVYVYDPDEGMQGKLIVYTYFGKNLFIVHLDYSTECYFLDESSASDLRATNPTQCRDYHRTYKPIAEAVLSSLVLYDGQGGSTEKIPTTLYIDTQPVLR